MADENVSISDSTCRKLQELAARSGRPVAEELDRAVENYYNGRFWEAVNAGYAELRADPEAWAAEQSERWAEDGTPLQVG